MEALTIRAEYDSQTIRCAAPLATGSAIAELPLHILLELAIAEQQSARPSARPAISPDAQAWIHSIAA